MRSASKPVAGFQVVGPADARARRRDADEILVQDGVVGGHVVGDEVVNELGVEGAQFCGHC
jgi:hypothetical protein